MNHNRFDGKTALITGGAGGMAPATSCRLLTAPMVAVHDLDLPAGAGRGAPWFGHGHRR